MNIFLKMAWRNIWRNKTRTFLTACVVFIAVVLSILMTSEQYGLYDKMIDNVIEITGHLQVQNKEYWGNKSINNAVPTDSALIGKIRKLPEVTGVTSHLESFALASYREMTKGVMVVGVVPSDEDEFSKLRKKLSQSSDSVRNYLTDADEGVLLGEKLANYLKVGINDTLVLISQGYHGISAAGLFPIRGFIKLPSIEMESSIVYMSLPAAQKFYGAAGWGTSILVKAENRDQIKQLQHQVESLLSSDNCVKTWEELQPEIVQMIDSDISSGYIMKGIFYMIIGFIIFSTLVMMMYERRREFGIMLAMGLQKFRLSVIVFFEILMISVMGTFAGLGIGYLITWLLNQHPIPLTGEMAKMMEEYGFEPVIFFSKGIDIFYWQPVVVFGITLFLYIFPLITIRRLKIVKSIRG
jgi:ABC-type lipoprotein release transport system permease subunit